MMTDDIMIWAAPLFEASLKGSILLLLALALVRLMRNSSAAARHAVLAAALGAFLLFPAVQLVAPRWTVPVRVPSAELTFFTEAPVETATSSVQSAPAAPAAIEERAAPHMSSPPLESAMTADVSNRISSGVAFGWREAIVLLWITGVAVILLRILAGMSAVWLLERRATMVTDGGWLHTTHALAQRLGLVRGITLLRGDRGSVPLTWGILQPVVWLPAGAEQWDSERRTVVLAHELAHVKRRDAVTQWLANIAVAIHWFNPLAWIVARRLRTERERACDDAVLVLGTQPTVYAEHLLAMVRSLGASSGPAAAMAMARRSQFEGRLLAILDGAATRRGLGTLRAAAVVIAAVALAVPLAGVSPAAPVVSADVPQSRSELGGYPVALSQDQPDSFAERSAVRVGEGRARSTAADRIGADAVPSLRLPPLSQSSRDEMVGTLLGDSAAGERLLASTAVRGDSALLLEVIAAASDITSSVERGRVLTRIARIPELDRNVVVALLESVRTMSSSLEKGKVLAALLETNGASAFAAGPTLLRTIGSISSSLERANLLTRVLSAGSIDDQSVTLALQSAAQISGSVERAKVVDAALRHQPTALGAAAPATFTVIDGIPASVERARLLIEIVGRRDLPDAVLARAFESARSISSSVERANVLVAGARSRTLSGEPRAAYLRAANGISSSSERVRALSALLPEFSGQDNEG